MEPIDIAFFAGLAALFLWTSWKLRTKPSWARWWFNDGRDGDVIALVILPAFGKACLWVVVLQVHRLVFGELSETAHQVYMYFVLAPLAYGALGIVGVPVGRWVMPGWARRLGRVPELSGGRHGREVLVERLGGESFGVEMGVGVPSRWGVVQALSGGEVSADRDVGVALALRAPVAGGLFRENVVVTAEPGVTGEVAGWQASAEVLGPSYRVVAVESVPVAGRSGVCRWATYVTGEGHHVTVRQWAVVVAGVGWSLSLTVTNRDVVDTDELADALAASWTLDPLGPDATTPASTTPPRREQP